MAINGQVLLFTFLLSLATSLIFGIAPALQLSKARLAESLKQDERRIAGAQGLRGVLITGEIALSLVLLIGAGLMIKSFVLLRSVNPGFNPESAFVLTVDLPFSEERSAQSLVAYHKEALEKLSSLPGVSSAGAIDWLPFDNALARGDFYTEADSHPRGSSPVSKPGVTPGYFRAMGIRLLRGRGFDNNDTANSPGVAIVSESVARRAWGSRNPIGKRVTLEDHPKPTRLADRDRRGGRCEAAESG